jgi:hypothetical protein
MHCIDYFIIPSQLYMFRAMSSSIIRSTWLYLQYLVVFTQVAAGWCLECVGLTTLPPSFADYLEIWEPQPPGTLWDCFILIISFLRRKVV